jgi:hypothetical protein
MRPNLFAPLTRMCVMVGLAAIVIAPPFVAQSAQPKPQPKLIQVSGTNATLADLERVVAQRCRILNGDQLKPGTNFYWWPTPAIPA